MGDFMREVTLDNLPQAVARGVRNHQAVDRYTDTHAHLRQLKDLFSRHRRRFAGIIIDVVFDHFLTKYWDRYSDESLPDFTNYCYAVLRSQGHLMPPAMQRKVDWMMRYDLLNSYVELQGVGNALNGISRRIRFENQLAGAVDEVAYHYRALEQGFLSFFTQLCRHINELKIEAGE